MSSQPTAVAESFDLDAERRIQGTRMVESMRQDRKSLIGEIKAVAKLYPFRGGADEASQRLSNFCQALGGYVALSHFGVFRRITDGEERRTEILDVAASVYPGIERSTRELLQFVERYKRHDPDMTEKMFTGALSAVGHNLQGRFAMEEQLLDAIGGD